MLRFLTAGESHGPQLTAIIDGLPAGLKLDIEQINLQLARRQRGYGRGHRMNIEKDQAQITAGLVFGQTSGAPLAIQIENRDWKNWQEKWQDGSLSQLTTPRPGHADFSGMRKYGLDDARPILERASARETAARVAVGAVARQLAAAFGVEIGSWVEQIGPVRAQIPGLPVPQLWALAEASDTACPDETAAQAMRDQIDTARRAKDTLGGVVVVTALGVPVGLGSHAQWDRRLDARIAAAMLSIQAIKGVEIGPAFENAALPGTQVHDTFLPAQAGEVLRGSNRAGGLEGGMTNGQPLVVRAAMKPIATTGAKMASVNLADGQPAYAEYQRSDICAVPAAAVVAEAMLSWVLAEALVEKLGGDSLAEMRR